jgi:hypothetical protein
LKTIAKYFFVLILLFSINTFGQAPEGKSPSKQAEQKKKANRRADRKEARERRKIEKQERKAIKAHHKRLQTKDVRKRMKKSRKKAIMNNTGKREPWYKRMFRKKKKV